MTAAFKPLKTIGETILAYRKARPDSSCEEILAYVKKNFPGCKTTMSSVASTFSHAGIAPNRIVAADRKKIPTLENVNAVEHDDEETLEDAKKRIFVRYQAMDRLVPRVVARKMASLIISGPPGVSKSWTVTHALEQSGLMRHDGLGDVGGGGPLWQDGEMIAPGYYDYIQGGCSEVGLFRALWAMRNGGIIVFDDCDGVFRDEDSLNLLKVATDTTRERLVSWRKNASWLDELEIDRTFDFRGHVVFLTNIDFENVIERNHPSSEHFRALIDRAAYLCLTLRNARDFMIVLEWKAGGADGFLRRAPYNFDAAKVAELFEFLRANQKRFYNLSLRLVGQIAAQMTADPMMWRADVEATKMRTI